MPSLKAQLRKYKHHPALGGMSPEAFERGRARIREAISGGEPTPDTSAMYMVLEYAKWNASQYLSKPAMAAAFSVVVIASGWLTTVRAADSLPGQKLYSVKLITEQAQLRLASLDRKAVLHTEFAGRRLQEASDLQEASSDDAASAPLVHQAIEAYKQEVSSAAESLRQLKDAGGDTALATATSVQQHLQDADTAIDAVAAETGSVEASQDAAAAKEATNEVSSVATTVAVEVQEEDQSDLSAQELKQMFKTELGQIEARQRFDLSRIEVIRTALNDPTVDYSSFTVPNASDLHAYEYVINNADGELSDAMNNFAAGGYRSAFATLQEVDSSMLRVESELAQVEITIMTAKAQVPAVTEPPVETPAADTTL